MDENEPPRKRPRMLSKACETCKAKKSRCDSARPCSLCRQKGTKCEYREKGQPGLRPGYGRAMESRMTELEDSMQKLSESMQKVLRQLQQGPLPVSFTPIATHASSLVGSGSEHGSPGDDTPQGSTAAGDTSNGAWLLLSPAATNKTTSEVVASMAASEAAPIPTVKPVHNPPEPKTDLPGLPPREILHELVELFFDRIYPWAPLFYKPNFMRNLAAHSTNNSNGNGETTDRLLLLHGITVLCFRFWAKPTPSPEARAAYISASRDQVLLRTIDACSLVSTQALTLLALDAVGQGPGPRTWNIMAMLVAAARQLILATHLPNRPRDEANTPVVNDEGGDEEEEDAGENERGDGSGDVRRRRNGQADGSAGTAHSTGARHDQSWCIEAEEKRRLFWVIYSLDRFASIFHGQPGAIDTKTIRLLYPSGDDEWGRPPASPEWFQGASDAISSRGQSSTADAVRQSSSGFGGAANNNLGTPSSNHASCSANIWHHYIDALTLVDRSHRLLIQPVNVSMPAHCQEWQSSFRRLDVVLTAWFENLPACVREGLPAPSASAAPAFNPMQVMVHAAYLLSFVRMYMIASFPATTSAYLRPSMAARTRLRHVCRDLATLTAAYQPHELQALGPIFVFIVWVGARSLVILWTRGGYSPDELCPAVRKSTFLSSSSSSSSSAACMLPPDLETLLTSLRHMAVRWPCAQRYVDIIQMIIDTKNSPGGPPGLEVFNDPRRTTYVIQSRFKALANERRASLHRTRGHDSGASEDEAAPIQQQSQHPHHYPQYAQYSSRPYSDLDRSQQGHGHHHLHFRGSHPESIQYPYQYPADPEPLMSTPFTQSFDFFDMPLLDAYDLTGPLIGTGTFGTEIDSEWL